MAFLSIIRLLSCAALLQASSAVVQRLQQRLEAASGLQLSTVQFERELQDIGASFDKLAATGSAFQLAYPEMKKRIMDVQGRLRAQQTHNVMVLLRERTNMQKRLDTQDVQLAAVGNETANLSASVKNLEETNRRHRNEAQKLLAKNAALKEDAEAMAHKLTVMSQVVDGVINDNKATVEEPVAAIRAQEAKAAHDAEVRRALGLTGSEPSTSFLQLSSTAAAQLSPRALIDSVMQSVAQVTREQKEEAENLQAAFKADFEEKSGKLAKAKKLRDELRKAQETQKDHDARLVAALDYLKQASGGLMNQSQTARNRLATTASTLESELRSDKN